MLQLARVLKNNWGERYDVARCACCACHAFLAGLLELLCGLASIACLGGSRQGVAFLPRCAADMLTHLPFLSDEHTAADLLFHAEKLAAAGPAKLHTLQLRLASLVAVTARRLAAAAAAGSERDEPAAVAAGSEDAQAAKALLGRLALSAASLLSSMATQAAGAGTPGAGGSDASSSGQLPPGVPGALYAALAAAQGVAPELGLQRLQDARRVGPLVEAARGVAASLGTALMQVSGWLTGWLRELPPEREINATD